MGAAFPIVARCFQFNRNGRVAHRLFVYGKHRRGLRRVTRRRFLPSQVLQRDGQHFRCSCIKFPRRHYGLSIVPIGPIAWRSGKGSRKAAFLCARQPAIPLRSTLPLGFRVSVRLVLKFYGQDYWDSCWVRPHTRSPWFLRCSCLDWASVQLPVPQSGQKVDQRDISVIARCFWPSRWRGRHTC